MQRGKRIISSHSQNRFRPSFGDRIADCRAVWYHRRLVFDLIICLSALGCWYWLYDHTTRAKLVMALPRLDSAWVSQSSRMYLHSEKLAALCTLCVLGLLVTGNLRIWHLYLNNALNGLMNTVLLPTLWNEKGGQSRLKHGGGEVDDRQD